MKKTCPQLHFIHKTQRHENWKKIIQVMIKKVFFVNYVTIRKKYVKDTNQISDVRLQCRYTIIMQEHLGRPSVFEITHWQKKKKKFQTVI